MQELYKLKCFFLYYKMWFVHILRKAMKDLTFSIKLSDLHVLFADKKFNFKGAEQHS